MILSESTTSQFGRLPPHSLDIEQCLIASVFLSGTADPTDAVCLRSVVRSIVDTQSFFSADHQSIWRAMWGLIDAGRALDAQTLRAELARLGQLEEVGGVPYLIVCMNAQPSHLHWRTYAEQVRDLYSKRRMITHANWCLREAYSPDRDAQPLLEENLKRAADIVRDQCGSGAESIEVLADEALADLDSGETRGVLTTFTELDNATGGVFPGELIVVGARPSMGKSTLLRTMCVRMARAATPVGFISLEENKLKWTRNLMSLVSEVENAKIRAKTFTAEEADILRAAVATLRGLPIRFTDKARDTAHIRAEAAVMVARDGCQCIFVDYLQRIHGRGKDRFEQVTDVSLALADMAKELNVPVVVAAQLNRASLQGDDKRPTLAALRESGQIEQDADAVIFLHREDYYKVGKGDYRPNHIAELIIAKWRDSTRGNVIRLKSELQRQRFVEPSASENYAPIQNEQREDGCPW